MKAARHGRIGLVPTMGAFHEGHLSLMREARKDCQTLVVSLFVNPTQFAAGEDFSKYPRNELRDAEMADSVGVDVLFAPATEEMYAGGLTTISVKGVSDRWEGAHRPGHFDGVATIVCKLFNIVEANFAIFGLKDLQQCAVIRRMVVDLNLPIEVRFAPTVREADGLAMSSRNVYLSPEDRVTATLLSRELRSCADCFSQGSLTAGEVERILKHGKSLLEAAGFKVDYLNLVDTESLEPKTTPADGDSVIVAARIGPTRLIDNVQLSK